MKVLIVFAMAALLLGCCAPTVPPRNGNDSPVAPAGTEITAPDEDEPAPVEGEGTIIEAPSGPGGDDVAAPSGKPAESQQDCATLTSSCGLCVSKPGCGWCKSSNSCLLGDSEGPDAGQCEASNWAVDDVSCSAPVDTVGTSCEDQYNCAFCLSGTGCKWCIQGSKCVPAGSSEDCFGGWLNQSYQCNYASR